MLEHGNLSWRYHSQRSEYIRRVKDYIEPDAWPNFEDFIADNSDFAEKFELHDKNVTVAEDRATTFYRRLLAAPIFNKEVNEAFHTYEAKIVSTQPLVQSIGSIKDHLPKFVAENLINNARELPAHYTIHNFWKNFSNEFQKYISEFEGYKGRQSFRQIEEAKHALKEVCSNLLRDLELRRQTLCREFDVPAAPMPAPRSTSEYMY